MCMWYVHLWGLFWCISYVYLCAIFRTCVCNIFTCAVYSGGVHLMCLPVWHTLVGCMWCPVGGPHHRHQLLPGKGNISFNAVINFLPTIINLNPSMDIGIDNNIEVIVVSLTTWEAHHSPRAKPEGCGELRRSLMRQQWPKLRYQFQFHHDEIKLMMNKQRVSN